MNKIILCVVTTFLLGGLLFAQINEEKPAWNVKLQANVTAPSNITVQNRCKKKHNFDIKLENLSFIEIEQTKVKVKGGKDKIVPVRFNTANLVPKTYTGNVLVICTSCKKEATCTQDRETLPVVLTILGDVKATSEQSPCKNLKTKCNSLLADWRNKIVLATNLQTTANTERNKTNKAIDEAEKAEEEARVAEEAARNEDSAYRAIVNGKSYHSNDVAYMKIMQAENLSAWQNGQISSDKYQKRAKEITPTKAREERLKNKARLKKEAVQVRKNADAKRKLADDLKKVADDAQKKANDAKAEAEKARKDYEECIKKVKAECEKLKEEQAKTEAEKKQREAEEKKARDEEEKLRVAEEKRKKAKEQRKKDRKEKREYLVDNIKKLGLIDSRAMAEVPGIWQWLPDILETPVSMLAEQKAGVPIPTDTLRALGGLYGIVGKMLDPCTKAGKEKTIERLQTMENPYTKKKYTWGQALKKTDDMCKLLGDLRGKLRALEKARKNK